MESGNFIIIIVVVGDIFHKIYIYDNPYYRYKYTFFE